MSLALCLLLIGDYFQQIPLVDEPGLIIWRFTKALANEHYDGNDLFSDVWGVMKMETPKPPNPLQNWET